MAKKSIKSRAQEVLELARTFKRDALNWLQAQNVLYGPGGTCSELFSTKAERVAFGKTDEHEQLGRILESLPEPPLRSIEKPRAEASGKLLLRLPKSLHAALIAEAESEGVSLNQLIVTKVAHQLRSAVGAM
jgi:predicted HicB family RNase H-like nuclease